MPSLFTEDERLARYSRLRKRRDAIEKILGIAMLITVVAALGEVIPALLESILGGLTLLRGLGEFFLALAGIVLMAAAVFAVYKRDWRITLGVFALIAVGIGGGAVRYLGVIQPIPLTAAMICDVFWAKLSKEEGFPQFQLEINRQEAAAKAWDFTARKRAVETGARAAVSEGSSDMHDLLDDRAEALNTDLTGYQERSQGADPLVHKAEQHSELMDTLEDF